MQYRSEDPRYQRIRMYLYNLKYLYLYTMQHVLISAELIE